MNLGQMLFNGKCKVFAPFYYIPMEIGIKYFLQGNFSIKIIKYNEEVFAFILLDDISICNANKDEEISQDVILPLSLSWIARTESTCKDRKRGRY